MGGVGGIIDTMNGSGNFMLPLSSVGKESMIRHKKKKR